MYEMVIRIFAFIGVFITVVIPWMLGVAGIFAVICQRLDESRKERKDE